MKETCCLLSLSALQPVPLIFSSQQLREGQLPFIVSKLSICIYKMEVACLGNTAFTDVLNASVAKVFMV